MKQTIVTGHSMKSSSDNVNNEYIINTWSDRLHYVYVFITTVGISRRTIIAVWPCALIL